jgi:hypothetical protein
MRDRAAATISSENRVAERSLMQTRFDLA